MAISKILHMKDCGRSFHGKHLKYALEYITVPEKTQNGRLVSAINCQVDNAFEQMKETKKKFNKTDKRQAYHIILSFKEGEVSPDTVFELTERFVKEYLGNDYEAVFAVHDNTEHPHSHIVFNSVSFRDGKKYHYQKEDWEKYIQPITNRLCKEYGLSTIELDEESGKRRGRDSYQEWNSYRDGKFVWSRMVARDVDACIIQAASFESFVSMLENKGYEVKNANGEGKYLAVKPQGMKRFVRLKSLGEEYTEERIRQRIYEENISSYIKENKPRIVYCRVRRYKRAKMSGLQKKYYARLYRIGKLKKKAYSVAWKYRDEKKKMQKLQAQYQFLVKELTEMIRSLTEAVQSHTGNYEAIEKMLKQMETIRLDEAVAKNLTSLNEKLEKENREFTEQLEGKQNEVNKGLQTIAQLRTELENLKKEMKIMQDRNTDLEQQISQRDETIREQGQAIIAKNSTIEKYKSAEEKAADEQHHGRTDLQEETVEKQSEIEMKENYDSQAVGQTQGAIPKQAATIPAGAIPVYANAGGIPVYYTMTLVQDQKVLQRTDVDYMHRKPSVFEGIMSKFAFKKNDCRSA